MVFTRVLLVSFLFFSYFTFAQEDEMIEVMQAPKMPKKEIKKEVSFMLVEHAPVFPGCEKEKTEKVKRRCLQQSMMKHVGNNFNIDLGKSLGLAPGVKRIMVRFSIDEKGSVKDIMVKAPHPKLEEEAIRLIKKLPKMMPAKQRGQAVTVKYTLPINFVVEEDELIKEENTK